MSDTVIRVENLSKQYRIGSTVKRYDTLRDQLTETLLSLTRRNGHHAPDESTIWALKDVSFEVKRGEVLGIIGRNGAGKSTLLKILSRITEPTSGVAQIVDRVGCLLEVGTGFHPELNGRENIYLNGAILGMLKSEIDRKFDEIVAFAEVKKFIDTPVKHYSSGMYVRLAFSVAAHLEPKILIVDEVLAVGDAGFQKKCLGKIGAVAAGGRTVLFVSHNFEAINSLCTRCLLLEDGRIIEDDTPAVCIQKSLNRLKVQVSPTAFEVQAIRNIKGIPQPFAVEIQSADKEAGELITFEDDIHATLHLDSPIQEQHTFAFQVLTSTGVVIFNSFYSDKTSNPQLQPGNTCRVCVTVPRQLLSGGVYEAVFAYMLPNAELFWLTRNTWFEVHDTGSYRNNGLNVKRVGLISLLLPWSSS